MPPYQAMQDVIKGMPEGAGKDQCQSLLKDARADLQSAVRRWNGV